MREWNVCGMVDARRELKSEKNIPSAAFFMAIHMEYQGRNSSLHTRQRLAKPRELWHSLPRFKAE
jgi:hypothetical protein